MTSGDVQVPVQEARQEEKRTEQRANYSQFIRDYYILLIFWQSTSGDFHREPSAKEEQAAQQLYSIAAFLECLQTCTSASCVCVYQPSHVCKLMGTTNGSSACAMDVLLPRKLLKELVKFALINSVMHRNGKCAGLQSQPSHHALAAMQSLSG